MSILNPPAVPSEPIFRFSVERYHEMIRAGILTEDDPVELLEGWLVAKMPKNRPHSIATRQARASLEGIVPDGWYVDSQEPITTDASEPEPDVVVVRGEPRDYRDRHPGPRDVALVVEVAEASLQRDRKLKKRIYACAGVPVYWIINLVDSLIEAYTDPTGPEEQPDYRLRQDFGPAEAVPVVIEGREVGCLAVRELLP